jgi:hypothetical protein
MVNSKSSTRELALTLFSATAVLFGGCDGGGGTVVAPSRHRAIRRISGDLYAKGHDDGEIVDQVRGACCMSTRSPQHCNGLVDGFAVETTRSNNTVPPPGAYGEGSSLSSTTCLWPNF